MVIKEHKCFGDLCYGETKANLLRDMKYISEYYDKYLNDLEYNYYINPVIYKNNKRNSLTIHYKKGYLMHLLGFSFFGYINKNIYENNKDISNEINKKIALTYKDGRDKFYNVLTNKKTKINADNLYTTHNLRTIIKKISAFKNNIKYIFYLTNGLVVNFGLKDKHNKYDGLKKNNELLLGVDLKEQRPFTLRNISTTISNGNNFLSCKDYDCIDVLFKE